MVIRCSFCGAEKDESRRFVAGTGVFICNRCLSLAKTVIATGAPASDETTTLTPVSGTGSERCSFCGLPVDRVGPVAQRGPLNICGPCAKLCGEIMDEAGRRLRVNHDITADVVRVMATNGQQLGIFPTEQALQMAFDRGLYLVEVVPEATPPVCRLMPGHRGDPGRAGGV